MIRTVVLRGIGLTALAAASAAHAAEEPPAAASAANTDQAILERLDALEEQVRALRARNQELEARLGQTGQRVEQVEARAARTVQPGIAPTFADPTGTNFTFKPRGVIEVDYGAYRERKGGYAYSNGTAIRRGRFGFDGTFLRQFRYRIEADFIGQQANLLDAYVQWAPSAEWAVTLGQHKTPIGLEANSSDNFNTFLERSMGTNAFGGVGGERRLGASVAYMTDQFTAQVGVFGSPELVTRNNGGPNEAYGVNGRITWDPVSSPDRILHVGASGFWTTNSAVGATRDAVRLSDRPDSRIDGGLIVDSGVITDVQDIIYLGAEGVAMFGPFSVQGEYGHLIVRRLASLSDVDFDGFNVFASFFITGERRPLKGGLLDRVKPHNNFDPGAGHWGAFEVALRYDRLNLGHTPVPARAGSDAETITAALNWYFTPNLKLMFNYVRFDGLHSPLAVQPLTHAAGDSFLTRVHLDF